MKKIIYLGFVLLILNLVSAGCFLHPSSPYYCQDIDINVAKLEMDYFQEPVYDYYLMHQSCAELQECQKIICRVNCEEEYLGKCPQGPLESYQQCEPGCCKFYTSVGRSCTYETNEWSCEIKAWNKETKMYSFEVTTEQQCLGSCGNFHDLNLKTITFNPAEGYRVKTLPQNATVVTEQELKEPDKGMNFIILLLVVSLAVGVIIYLYKKFPPKNILHLLNKKFLPKKSKQHLTPKKQTIEIKKTERKENPERSRKIKKIKREQMLTEAGLLPEEIKEDDFSKLRQIYIKQGIPSKKLTKEEKEEYIEKLKKILK